MNAISPFGPTAASTQNSQAGVHLTQGQFSGLALERLQPQGYPCVVVSADQQGLAIGHPDGTLQVSVDVAGEIDTVTAYRRSQEYLVGVVPIAIAGIPIGQSRAVG